MGFRQRRFQPGIPTIQEEASYLAEVLLLLLKWLTADAIRLYLFPSFPSLFFFTSQASPLEAPVRATANQTRRTRKEGLPCMDFEVSFAYCSLAERKRLWLLDGRVTTMTVPPLSIHNSSTVCRLDVETFPLLSRGCHLCLISQDRKFLYCQSEKASPISFLTDG